MRAETRAAQYHPKEVIRRYRNAVFASADDSLRTMPAIYWWKQLKTVFWALLFVSSPASRALAILSCTTLVMLRIDAGNCPAHVSPINRRVRRRELPCARVSHE
jgi:hypothetical protein